MWAALLLWVMVLAALFVASFALAGYMTTIQTSCLSTKSLKICGDAKFNGCGMVHLSSSNVAAGGTTQQTATPILTQMVNVNSATANGGVRFPCAKQGQFFLLVNTAGVSIQAYPPPGAAFLSQVVDSSITLAADQTAYVAVVSPTSFYFL